MSTSITVLHSHSGIERECKFPKHIVLIDEQYVSLFEDTGIKLEPFRFGPKIYYKTPIRAFVRKGGLFKNLNS